MTNQFFSEIGHLFKIGIRPIGLEHRELRIMFSGDAFVAKVAIDFENLVEPTHEQTFEIKLQRNAHIEIDAERLVMRFERFGRSAAGDSLQNRRLYFQNAAVLKKTPRFSDNRNAFFENLPRTFVRKKVEITLPIPGFDVL